MQVVAPVDKLRPGPRRLPTINQWSAASTNDEGVQRPSQRFKVDRRSPRRLVSDVSGLFQKEIALAKTEACEKFDSVVAAVGVLFAACDYTQLPDVPDDATKAAWATYRQALRDLPANTTDPSSPNWPLPPAGAS